MFSDRYAEGKNLANNAPAEIKLDDDGTTLCVLLLLLHMRHGHLPGVVAVKPLLALALLSDKYDCAEAVRLVSGLWFVNLRLTDKSFTEKGQLLEAAYLLRNAEDFRHWSQQLVIRHTVSFTELMAGRLSLESLR